MRRGYSAFIILGIILVALGVTNIGKKVVLLGFNPFKNNGIGGITMDINQEKSHSIDAVKKLEVKSSSETINLYITSEKEVRAYLYGSMRLLNNGSEPQLEISKYGDTLKVEVILPVALRMGYYNTKLDVYVPDSYNEDFTINSSSGSIKCNDQIYAEDFSAASSSGTINIDYIKSGNVKISSSSGSINVSSDCTEAQIYSTSGSVNINELSADRANIESSSGAININGKCDEVSIRSTSGSIKSNGLNTESTTIHTSSGSCNLAEFTGDLDHSSTSGTLNVSYLDYDNDITASTSSGTVNISLDRAPGFDLKFNTSSGFFTCKYPLNNEKKERNESRTGTVGDGYNTIRVKTTSGALNIR